MTLSVRRTLGAIFAGALVYSLGWASNNTVGLLNGEMPVLVPRGWVLVSPGHIVLTSSTRLSWLADRFVIVGDKVASIGDFLLWAGELTIILAGAVAIVRWMAAWRRGR